MVKSPEIIDHLAAHRTLPEWAMYQVRVPEAKEIVDHIRLLRTAIEKRDDHIAAMREQLTAADRRTMRAVDEARRISRLESALRVAREALTEAPRECRFHGTDFDKSGRQHGVPRCESCRQPWLVTTALMNVTAELGEDLTRA